MNRRSRTAAALGVGAVLISATVALYIASRGKWSDPIIDSGSEWIYPEALAHGDLLYRDVVYWFGPVTPYFHAVFFRLFGSSYATLVLAGVVGSLGVLVCLYAALRCVTQRQEAALWTALAIPALVFMPNSGGSILGMGYRIWHPAAFTLLALALAGRPAASRVPCALGVGTLCAAAALGRAEWGIGAFLSVLAVWAARDGFGRVFVRESLACAATLLLVFGAIVGGFVAAAGSKAVFEDSHLLLTGIPEETRTFLLGSSGIEDWREGILVLLYSAGMWLGAVLLIRVVAVARSDPPRAIRRLAAVAGVLLLLVVLAVFGGAGGAVLFSAAPLVSAAALVAGFARRYGAPALAGFGLAGLLLSHRRTFHIADGSYVGPPLLFAFVCSAGLLQELVDSEKGADAKDRLRAYSSGAVVLLILFAFATRIASYRAEDRVPIPGTEGMLSARPELAATIAEVARTIRRETEPVDRLVVFPEGALFNYLTGRRNPIRHKLFIPGYLSDRNEAQILAELRRAAPEGVLVWPRATGEYGRGGFGDGYGTRIRAWIEDEYEPVRFAESRRFSRVFLGIRRSGSGARQRMPTGEGKYSSFDE